MTTTTAEAECFKAGKAYVPLDMRDVPAQYFSEQEDCKAYCGKQDGGGYFTYYVPLGLCHCESLEGAHEEDSDINNIGGSVNCAVDVQDQNGATLAIEAKLGSQCYQKGIAYIPFGLPIVTKNSIECQKSLKEAGQGKYFIFFASTGFCHFTTDDSPQLTEMPGAVTGPADCEVSALVQRNELDSMASVRPLSSVSGVVLSAAALAVTVSLVFGSVALHRQLRASSSRSWDAEALLYDIAETSTGEGVE